VLLLFDIDGTLVRSRPLAHQRALAYAAIAVFGLPDSTDEDSIRALEPWGKTDREILRDLLGRSPSRADAERWERAACERYAAIEDAEPDDADGATAAALTELAADGHALALVTGNLEPIARRKLDGRGLGGFFPAGQGGFGSDALERTELVRIARRRAGTPPPAQTTLIGDTPRDVAAALGAGVRAIGVAGSRYSREDLLGAGADAAVDAIGEVRALLPGLGHGRLGAR
jgi:phosphoglycolate phosphatase-like HAD superfamily hydrolase